LAWVISFLGRSFALSLNGLDLGDQPPVPPQLAGRVQPLGLRLDAQPEQVFAGIASVSANCSSLISRNSTLHLGILISLTPAAAGQTAQGWASCGPAGRSRPAPALRSRHQLVQHRPRLDHRYPKLRLAFAFAHARFQRRRRHGLVGKNADVQTAFAAHVLLRRDTPGFDRLRLDPPPLEACSPKSPKTTLLPRVALPFIRPLWLFRCLTRFGISAIESRLLRTYLG
jgi:hypothetical protein